MMEESKSMDKEEVRATLANNPLFKGLDPFYIDDFIPSGELQTWPKGSQVICEGDSGNIVYFILKGRAKVSLYSEEGREIVLAVLEEGEMFGEMSIIDDKSINKPHWSFLKDAPLNVDYECGKNWLEMKEV